MAWLNGFKDKIIIEKKKIQEKVKKNQKKRETHT